MAESLLPPLTCDTCGREMQRKERGIWPSVVRHGGTVNLLCPACREAECRAERAEQRADKYSDPPRKAWF